MGSSMVWGTYGVFEGRNMSGVARRRYAIGVGEGGRKGCPLTMDLNVAYSIQQSPTMPNQLARMKGVPYSEAVRGHWRQSDSRQVECFKDC